MRNVRDMSVLVTGGGSGIGESTAELLVNQGARVTISGRRAAKLQAVADRLGEACSICVGDVTDASDRHRMLSQALQHGGKLDALVNNAANMYRQAVTDYTEEHLREAFDTNVISAMLLSSAAVPHLIDSQGAIIFIGSTHTRRAFPGASPYATTKAALEGLTRVMASELGGQGVRVNCVLPGAVVTELNLRAGVITEEEVEARYASVAKLHALGRVGTGEEVAESVIHLMTAEWVTGVCQEVDGGISLGVSSF